jgi:glucosamine-6-phosphate deaminase
LLFNASKSVGMNLQILSNASTTTLATADWLAAKLVAPGTRNVMLAGGNTPLALYAEIARRRLPLAHLHAFALDEYVGVPEEEPRNCANLIRRTAVEPWGIPAGQYHPISSLEVKAESVIREHEAKICAAGGIDVLILGLGKNGHIGFNEPGSAADSEGRLLPLSETSINANREWFGGDYAPAQGVTTGMKLLLEAKSILLLAFGSAKAVAAQTMIEGPPTADCPASFLQRHGATHVFLDQAAAATLAKRK